MLAAANATLEEGLEVPLLGDEALLVGPGTFGNTLIAFEFWNSFAAAPS